MPVGRPVGHMAAAQLLKIEYLEYKQGIPIAVNGSAGGCRINVICPLSYMF